MTKTLFLTEEHKSIQTLLDHFIRQVGTILFGKLGRHHRIIKVGEAGIKMVLF